MPLTSLVNRITKELANWTRVKRFDGIFIVPTAEWFGETGSRIQCVVLDRIRKTETLPSVAMDYAAAVTMAFDALHGLRHRNI